MTTPSTHPLAAPWRGAFHPWSRPVHRAPAATDLALLVGWALLLGLFLIAVA